MDNYIKQLSDNKIEARIFCVAWKEVDIYIAFAPSLKLTSNSKDSIEDAKKNLKVAIEWFFKYYNTKELIDKELKRLGWKDHNEPKTQNIPISIFD